MTPARLIRLHTCAASRMRTTAARAIAAGGVISLPWSMASAEHGKDEMHMIITATDKSKSVDVDFDGTPSDLIRELSAAMAMSSCTSAEPCVRTSNRTTTQPQ